MLKEILLLVLLSATQAALFPPGYSSDPRLRTARLPRTGGFHTVSNPSGGVFEFALNKVLSLHPELSRNDLMQVESQVVAGMNYRFTFKQSNGEDAQYTTYISLEDMGSIESRIKKTLAQPAATLMRLTAAPNNKALRTSTSSSRGEEKGSKYRSILDTPDLYRPALEAIFIEYAWSANYNVIAADVCLSNSNQKKILLRGSNN